MAPAKSRRSLLRTTAVPLVAALAGCGFEGRQSARQSVTPAPVPTDSPAPTVPPVRTPRSRPTQLSFDASVVQQRSANAPPKFRVTLTNVGPNGVTVHIGASLLWSVDGVYPEELVFLPEQITPPAVPTTPVDDCWRYSGDRHPAIPAIALFGELSPDEFLTTTFAVYGGPTSDRCYPPGEYVIRDNIGLGPGGGAIRKLGVTLSIDESGVFSVRPTPRELWV